MRSFDSLRSLRMTETRQTFFKASKILHFTFYILIKPLRYFSPVRNRCGVAPMRARYMWWKGKRFS